MTRYEYLPAQNSETALTADQGVPYSLLLIIRFEANRSESNSYQLPIRFVQRIFASKYLLRFALIRFKIFASKLNEYSLRFALICFKIFASEQSECKKFHKKEQNSKKKFVLFLLSIICLYAYIRFFQSFASKQIKANLTLLFASKRINIRFDICLYSLRSEYQGHPTLTPSLGAQEPVLQCSTPHFEFICASIIFIRFNYIRFISYSLAYIRFEANQSESDPFIRFKANKYSLRYSLQSEYRGHPTADPSFLTTSLQNQHPHLSPTKSHNCTSNICQSLHPSHSHIQHVGTVARDFPLPFFFHQKYSPWTLNHILFFFKFGFKLQSFLN